jgi:hypothetical protein
VDLSGSVCDILGIFGTQTSLTFCDTFFGIRIFLTLSFPVSVVVDCLLLRLLDIVTLVVMVMVLHCSPALTLDESS